MRYNIVEELINNTELRQALQVCLLIYLIFIHFQSFVNLYFYYDIKKEEHLKKMPDFKRIGKKFQRNTASLQVIYIYFSSIEFLVINTYYYIIFNNI